MMSAALDRWPPKIRPMTEDDLDAVWEIEKRAYSYPWSRGIFVDCLFVPYVCEILEEGGRIIGYAIMAPAGDEAHLLNLCLDEGARGRGLGAHLLKHVMQRAASEGVRVLYLEVRPSNALALKLYRRAGFARIGIRRNYYRAAGGREDALVLARTL
jgi:[ribosomal protein S18]-alanine N-acetyltransferase